MKSFSQLVLRRTRAPKQAVRRTEESGASIRVPGTRAPEITPVVNAMRVDIPSEVIDLRVTPLPASRPRVTGRRREPHGGKPRHQRRTS